MPIINNAHVNPLTTYKTFGPDTRGPQGGDSNSYVFKDVAAGATVSLPAIETYPATFVVCSSGGANHTSGIVTVHGAAAISLIEISNFAASAASNKVVPSAAGGVLTLTPNATTFTTRDIVVTRIG